MSGSDGNNNDKSPQDAFKNGIKSVVGAFNGSLESLQQTYDKVKAPAQEMSSKVSDVGAIMYGHVKTTYQERHQYPVEIIGGAAAMSGTYFLARRGKIAATIGAIAGGATAYAIVYDEITLKDLENVPATIFRKKD
eukprot:CAMPEP_0113500568 /NCGR_PEP_ID=MMETSP0014_2-20120614/32408_1 /TAXON_ID=2857 /ORGANISM="Nitzschia sp." /LENGTH=135 /DNA_ID=CAMNT_0000394933 /DNA_START=146 /DNA_END=553 /DNA_ORIENTATION=- /assembly_acc=CAM_ASM_000159